MLQMLMVGLGGFCGAILRFVIATQVQRRVPAVYAPAGTLAVNLLGCFVIGILTTLVAERSLFSPQVRLLLITGILGSLTTFSTFGYETWGYLQTGEVRLAIFNVGSNLILGLLAVWAGCGVAKLLT